MSTRPQPASKECTECSDQYETGYGEYCSERCYYAHKGEKALNLLRHDHRLCTCGRWLKEIEEPSDDWLALKESAIQECIVGFQYRTPNATTVQKDYEIDEYHTVTDTGTGCECGVTDGRTVAEELHAVELATVLSNYVKRFRELEREGQLHQRINKDVFFASFRETRDIQFALGKALHG